MRFRSVFILICGLGPLATAGFARSREDIRPFAEQRLDQLESEVRELRLRLAQSESEVSRNGQAHTTLVPAPAPGEDRDVPRAPVREPVADWSPQWVASPREAVQHVEYPTVRVTGMFHLDTAFYDQDAVNEATLGDIESGTAFRRVRFGATGNVTPDTSYLFEFDLAQAAPRFADVWLEFDSVPNLGGVRIGRFRQPFGMTELTSIRALPFLERPLPFVLTPFRQTGIMVHDVSEDQRMTLGLSGYRYLTDNFGNVFGDSGGFGAATRFTCLPHYKADCSVVHLGVGYSYNDPARDLVQFATTNEVFVGQNPNFGPPAIDFLPIVAVPPFVNTGVVPVDDLSLFNLEAAAQSGSFLVQSELRWAVMDQLDGVQNTFPGVYAHARYVLTGETVTYDTGSGTFGALVPESPVRWGDCGIGAWEVAGRISHVDLNGPALPGPGRRLTDLTAGLNWYVNVHTKFQFNYIHAMLDDPALGGGDAHTYALRGQLDF